MQSRLFTIAGFMMCGGLVYADEPAKPATAEKTAAAVKIAALDIASQAKKGPKQPEGSHAATKTIAVKGLDKAVKLQTLTMAPDGLIYALLGADRYGSSKAKSAEVQVFDPAGEKLRGWTVDFLGQSIGCAPDGTILVAGNGRIAAFKSSGDLIKDLELPHIKTVLADQEKLKQKAEEQRKSQIESYEQIVNEQKKEIDELTKKDPEYAEAQKTLAEKQKALTELRVKLRALQAKKEDTGDVKKQIESCNAEIKELQNKESNLSKEEKQQLKQAESMVRSYQTVLEQQKKQTVDRIIGDIASRVKIINSVAATDKDIFLVCGEVKGHGYAIWRMTRDFEEPKEIMSGVRGCCGQMDIQAFGDDLWVAQNCDHKVGHYDRDGKKIATFGKRGRDGDGDCFGGCCNPMNCRVGPNGNIYTAESEGIVRLFSASGESKGVVGGVTLAGGCKNVAVAVSPDGNTVYFCDQPGSKIHVMTRKPEPPAKGAE